jgi:hypothetical protein
MLTECKIDDFKVGDTLYFERNVDNHLIGPYLVLGWSQKHFQSGDTISFLKSKPTPAHQLVVFRIDEYAGYGFFSMSAHVKFFKSDEIFLQEKV